MWCARDGSGTSASTFTVADGLEASGRPRLKGAYTINVDGSDMKEVFGYNDNGSPRGLRIDSLLDTEGGDSTVAYVSMRERSREYADVYKLDFRTMRHELLTLETPGRTMQWELDSERRPRVAVREEPRPGQGKPLTITFWHRAPSGGAWERMFAYNYYVDSESYSICGFDKDDRTLFVTARRGRDKSALWRYDTQTKQFGEMVLDDPLVDLACNSGSDESEGSGSDGGRWSIR